MASIKIHQDLFNFEKRRKGFTPRQLTGLGAGIAVTIAVTALFGYALGVYFSIAVSIGICFGAPCVAVGFVPVWGMPAEEALRRFLDLSERGNAICFEGSEIEGLKGETTRDYRKKARKPGAECRA